MRTLDEDAIFAAALEECGRRVQQGEVLEQCLADYPSEYREELARLVPLVAPLSRLGRDPSPEFQARLEQRLFASVEEARRSRRAGPTERIGRFFATSPLLRAAALAVVALLVVVGSGMGAVQASASSLPDDPLYRVKTAREWVQLALARDEESRVGVQAGQIDERARELERALQPGKQRKVVEAVALQAARGVERMVDQALEARARGKPLPSVRALTMIRQMERRLDRLLEQAPAEARPPLQRLQSFLREQERRLLGRGAAAPRV